MSRLNVFRMMVIAIFAAGAIACSQQPQQKETGEPSGEPAKEATQPAGSAGQAGTQIGAEGLNAEALVKNATFVTREWPGHPDWSYVYADKNTLVLAAHMPNDKEQTTIRIPLQSGRYQISGKVSLRPECKFPVTFLVKYAGEPGDLIMTDFYAGHPIDFNQTMNVEAEGKQVEFVVKMGQGAQTNDFGTVTITDFKLTRQ